MTPETFIIAKASEAIQALYDVQIPEAQLQVQVTRKEFEGDYTLVVFPLLKVSKTTPENTGNAIGEWLVANVPEISGYNTVKGFLNISFSEVYWNNVFAEIAASEDFGQLPLFSLSVTKGIYLWLGYLLSGMGGFADNSGLIGIDCSKDHIRAGRNRKQSLLHFCGGGKAHLGIKSACAKYEICHFGGCMTRRGNSLTMASALQGIFPLCGREYLLIVPKGQPISIHKEI